MGSLDFRTPFEEQNQCQVPITGNWSSEIEPQCHLTGMPSQVVNESIVDEKNLLTRIAMSILLVI